MMSAPGGEVFAVNVGDQTRSGQHQQVIVALEIRRPSP
jgi:hypothetical protein